MLAAPERSLQQRLEALNTANSVRTYRADLKRDMKAGKITIISLLYDPPKQITNMKVIDLLLAAPKMGQVKAHKRLNRCRISPSKTIGGLTRRQRDELISTLYR